MIHACKVVLQARGVLLKHRLQREALDDVPIVEGSSGKSIFTQLKIRTDKTEPYLGFIYICVFETY
jgi:hypothetical protein